MLGSSVNTLWPYGYGYAKRYISQQYDYFLQPFDPLYYAPPYDVPFDPLTNYPLPISLSTVKKYLRIDSGVTADDEIITLLMQVAVQFGENYTKRDFIIKKYLTFRNDFSDGFFVPRKSPFSQLLLFQYMVDGLFINVPTVYYTTRRNDYSEVMLLDGQSWPNNLDNRLQAIQMVFLAGYGYLEKDIPIELKNALFQHIAQMYENRGDCSGINKEGCSEYLPATAKMIYDQFRIHDLTTIPY